MLKCISHIFLDISIILNCKQRMSFRKSQAESREATEAPKASDDYRFSFTQLSPDLRPIGADALSSN